MPAGLADTDGPATAPTALSGWLGEHSSELGLHYANELHRHFRASPPAPPVPATPDRRGPAAGAVLLLAPRGGRDRVEGVGRASG